MVINFAECFAVHVVQSIVKQVLGSKRSSSARGTGPIMFFPTSFSLFQIHLFIPVEAGPDELPS